MKKLNPESVNLAAEFLRSYGIGIRQGGFGLNFDWETTKNTSRRLAALSIRCDGFGLSTASTTWTWEQAQQMAKEVQEVMAILVGLDDIDPELLYRE